MKLSAHEEILQDSIQVHNFVKMLPVVYQCFWLFGRKTIGGSLDENAWKSISRRRLISCGKVNAEKKLRRKCHTAKILAAKFQMAELDSGEYLPDNSPTNGFSPGIFPSNFQKHFPQRKIPRRRNSSQRKFPSLCCFERLKKVGGMGQMSAPNPLDIHRQTELLWTSLGPSLAHKEFNRNKQYSEK